MTEGNPIINLGDISKPATVLIEKISDAVGGYFKPYQIKRVAEAEADAEIVRAQAQIEVTDLQRRALTRFVAEEAKKQDNIETITKKAIPHLDDSSNPKDMEDDWVTNFFDKCRIVSDEEMQTLWSHVLAGEANSPGTFSKRTVNLLGSLDKEDAKIFTSLCGFCWYFGDLTPLIYDANASIYNDTGINFPSLSHLDDIGLISFQSLSGFKRLGFPKYGQLFYYGKPVVIEFKKEEKNEIETGKALLTKTGQQLARVCGSQPVNGFMDYVFDNWTKKGLILSSPYPQNQ